MYRHERQAPIGVQRACRHKVYYATTNTARHRNNNKAVQHALLMLDEMLTGVTRFRRVVRPSFDMLPSPYASAYAPY